MNKRSAALMAAGLVAVLALGGVAFSLGLIGPTASVAAPQAPAAVGKPIVHTHTKRIVVHRQATAVAPVTARTTYHAAPANTTTYGYDDSFDGLDDGGSGGGSDD